MPLFEIPVRVYYEDTDAEGVVYYANYLRFMERARSEWLRHHQIPPAELLARDNIIFVVTRVELDYRRPARLDDVLSVSVELKAASAAAFTLHQAVSCDGKTLCSGVLKLACLDASRFKPVRIPGKINQLINPD